jgi:large subunit ribosomal protein L13
MTTQIVIDATGAVLGRLASYAAKRALLGKQVIIINCNDALLTGNKANILEEYLSARRRGKGSQKGPYFPKIPERLVKRTIRGMLQYTKQKGWDAFKRIVCYNETPNEYESAKKITIVKELQTKSIKLSELTKLL